MDFLTEYTYLQGLSVNWDSVLIHWLLAKSCNISCKHVADSPWYFLTLWSTAQTCVIKDRPRLMIAFVRIIAIDQPYTSIAEFFIILV